MRTVICKPHVSSCRCLELRLAEGVLLDLRHRSHDAFAAAINECPVLVREDIVKDDAVVAEIARRANIRTATLSPHMISVGVEVRGER